MLRLFPLLIRILAVEVVSFLIDHASSVERLD